MVGSDLIDGGTLDRTLPTYPVDLHGGDDASGLADLLHQFLSQNLAELPQKERQARRLRSSVLFRSAEDLEVCVRIAFHGDRIEISDYGGDTADRADRMPTITSDFLSTAHLTTGEEGPFALLVKRKIRVRFAPSQAAFLFRVLRFMRISPDARIRRLRRRRWVVAGAITLLIVLLWYLSVSM